MNFLGYRYHRFRQVERAEEDRSPCFLYQHTNLQEEFVIERYKLIRESLKHNRVKLREPSDKRATFALHTDSESRR
jgi:hypothetical protein